MFSLVLAGVVSVVVSSEVDPLVLHSVPLPPAVHSPPAPPPLVAVVSMLCLKT